MHLFYDKPKGFIKKSLFILFFALVLPAVIIAYLDIDAKEITQTSKVYETNTVVITSKLVANKLFNPTVLCTVSLRYTLYKTAS